MHEAFRELLKDAEGFSEFVVAINIDIRDFSPFSKRVESPDVAMYIKRVYMKLIDDYFERASFYKATGDGLLVTIPYSENTLESVTTYAVLACLTIMFKFDSFCEDDPMIIEKVPNSVGIGICRGTACRLASGGQTLDYSGSLLNLASRLMDIARPEGVVIDGSYGMELLPDTLQKYFQPEEVYIRGIAEKEPISIYYTKDYTVISPERKKRLDEPDWYKIKREFTFRQIKALSERFEIKLPSLPSDSDEIIVKIIHPLISGGKKSDSSSTSIDFESFDYVLEAGEPSIIVNFTKLGEYLDSLDFKQTWKAQIIVKYPEEG